MTAGDEWRPAPGDSTGRGRARYRRWDGTQQPAGIEADELLDALSEDILADGDLEDALRRMMEDGLPADRDRAGLTGLRELLRRLADRRRELLERHGLGDVMGDLRRQLQEIVDTER